VNGHLEKMNMKQLEKVKRERKDDSSGRLATTQEHRAYLTKYELDGGLRQKFQKRGGGKRTAKFNYVAQKREIEKTPGPTQKKRQGHAREAKKMTKTDQLRKKEERTPREFSTTRDRERITLKTRLHLLPSGSKGKGGFSGPPMKGSFNNYRPTIKS